MKLQFRLPVSVRRGVRHGWLSLRRERGWKTTLGLLAALLVLLQFSIVTAATVQGIDHLLRSQLDLRLELKNGVPPQRVMEFIDAVKKEPTIAQVLYVTREQAYQSEKNRNPSLIAFLEQFNIQNPFPDTVAVTLKSLDDYDKFSGFVRQQTWADVVDPAFLSSVTDQEKEVMNLLELTQSGRKLVAAVMLFLVLVLLAIIVELVRRRALYRQEEIQVEQLTGASSMWILMPFITETCLLLWSGLAASTLFIGLLLFLLPALIPSLSTLGEFATLRQHMMVIITGWAPIVLPLEIVAAPVVAWLGSVLALHLHWRDRAANMLRRLHLRKA